MHKTMIAPSRGFPALKVFFHGLVVIGTCALGILLVFLLLAAASSGFTLIRMRSSDFELFLLVCLGIITVVVPLADRIFRRTVGRAFDEEPEPEIKPVRPDVEKSCLRCGEGFGAYHNDFHQAGFCSRACREAYTKSRKNP
jgi:hypothetical protein